MFSNFPKSRLQQKPNSCAAMSSGFTGARVNQKDTKQKEFSTVNKDGKTVWEPGLPALVTSRRQHRPRTAAAAAVEDVPPVSCDLRLILKMSASNKADWLEKALKAMMAGKTKVQDVFNIVTHPKFASGVSEKYGKRMFQMVTENMDHFSDKQRLTLSRCKLASGDAKEDSEDEAKTKRRRRSRSRSQTARSATASPPRPKSGNPPQEDDEDSKRQEEEKRRVEAQKRKLKEQEEKRKAKLGSAFQFEPEDEAESTKKQLQNKLEKASRKEELPSLALAWGSGGRDADPRFVEAMGGDKLLQEAHKILRHAAGSGRIDSRRSRSRSRRSRSRRRNRERSRSPKGRGGPHVRSSGSYRSPTPDGRARGQARAARKAKMIASLMGIKR
eukprot:s2088_g4.t1